MSALIKEKLNPVVGVDTSKNYCYHLAHNDNGTFSVAICYEGVNGWFNAVANGKAIVFDSEKKGQKLVDSQNKLLGKAVIDVAKITLSSMGF
jgi:hypothetical protein